MNRRILTGMFIHCKLHNVKELFKIGSEILIPLYIAIVTVLMANSLKGTTVLQ